MPAGAAFSAANGPPRVEVPAGLPLGLAKSWPTCGRLVLVRNLAPPVADGLTNFGRLVPGWFEADVCI